MRMKKMRVFAVGVIMLLGSMFMTACGSSSEEDLDIDSGVVYYSHRKTVKVHEDDGENDSHRVSRTIVRRCSVGERWPDCKKK